VNAGSVSAIVLAAGQGRRFGGEKLVAALEGRPVLQHVLDALAGCALLETVVVLGPRSWQVAERIRWHGERRVENPDARSGLASSLRVGLASADLAAEAALICLGDQPRLRRDVIAALLAARLVPGELAAVPAYAEGGHPNPVLLLRAGWHLAQAASGDRGLGPILAARPDVARVVAVSGSNPDVDTAEDLLRVAGEAADPADGQSGSAPRLR
jgi:CTP:molybdopterin cytidylyltransferase MocA